MWCQVKRGMVTSSLRFTWHPCNTIRPSLSFCQTTIKCTIKRTLEQTWVGVWPKSSRSGLVSDKGCSEGSSQTIWFSTSACFPACNLIPEASYITTLANIAAVAKREQRKPSWKPIAIAKAVTVAECDDGMPPEPMSCLGSHLFSLYHVTKNLMDCAMANPSRAATRG
uniref:Uncharacterized protein n=1 Tax=Arundo donax TaxID=35708 RepID=A0A0A9DMH4_ARUDO